MHKPWFDKECLLKLNLPREQDPWKICSVCTNTGGQATENKISQLSTAVAKPQYTITGIKIPNLSKADKNVYHRAVE
jgi:hypothetical protein